MIDIGKFEIIVSEKSSQDIQGNKYTFIVDSNSNKKIVEVQVKRLFTARTSTLYFCFKSCLNNF